MPNKCTLTPEQLDELRKYIPCIADIWIYDTEVFLHDWLLIFEKLTTGERRIFHNDNYAATTFLDEVAPVLGGYNVKHYDQWILKAIYHNADNATIKALNDYIIVEGNNDPWTFDFLEGKRDDLPQQFDLMDDIATFLRLKEVEGNLGMDIEETEIDFNLPRPLNDDEYAKTVQYCGHDVSATVKLMYERKDYLASKIAVGNMMKLTAKYSMPMTNAKLTAKFLNARQCARNDEFEYDFPTNLIIDKYLDVVKFFGKIDSTYSTTLNIDIAGVPHTIAWGGLHGALDTYTEEKTENRKIMHIDVTSYYPSLMIQNHYMSRNVPDPDGYKRVYETRIAAKKAGDNATANALKLVLNTTYGAMKNQYNGLYDPHMANAVCISGQLYLIDLIEKLESIPTFKLIQSNTDGLIVSYDCDVESKINYAVHVWETRTGFHMGFDGIDKIVQKDVNNYIMRGTDGAVEVKGGYVSNYEGGDFKNKSLSIVAKAIVANLFQGTPPEETVNGCDDIEQFQMITKAGHTYDKVVWVSAGQDIEVQNVNRAYASKNMESGSLYKIKLATEDKKERRDKIANVPAHCIIDNRKLFQIGAIDKQFYIKFAEKRINDYLGVKPPKKERRKKTTMVTHKIADAKTEAPKQEAPLVGLGAKLMKLRAVMSSFKWEKDGKNRYQSYSYITDGQYKSNFNKALAAAGLDFKFNITSYQHDLSADKMSMTHIEAMCEIIDRESGEKEEYTTMGDGADTGDKGIYKAYTGAIKYFVADNFLVSEGSDPENDIDETQQEKPKYTPPAKREAIKENISNQEAPATDVQIESIADGIAQMEESGLDKEIIVTFTELLETELTKDLAEQTIDAMNELLQPSTAA